VIGDQGSVNTKECPSRFTDYKPHTPAYFVTGQLGGAGRLFVPRERTVFQAISQATVPGGLYRSQLKSAGRTRRRQNGF